MARLNKADIEKLPPEERLRRLKEIEEEDKKEIEETEMLIKKVESELKSPKITIEAPPLEPVDITKLFEKDTSLEGTVKKEAPKQDKGVKYQSAAEGEYDAGDTAGYGTMRPGNSEDKIENLKYKPATDDVSRSTATRQQLKDIHKYQRG